MDSKYHLAAIETLVQEEDLLYTSHIKDYEQRPGCRLIIINKGIFDFAIRERLLMWAFSNLMKLLPPDAKVLNLDGQIIRMIPTFHTSGSGLFQERYSMIFVSKEWPTVEEGTKIPELELHIEFSLKEVNET